MALGTFGDQQLLTHNEVRISHVLDNKNIGK